MKKLSAALLAGTILTAAFATGANAVVVGVNQGGATGTTTISGIVDVYSTTIAVPGLNATLGLTYLGSPDSGETWNFSYSITNATSGGINNSLTSRLYSWGLLTTPNPADATISSVNGVYNTALIGDKVGGTTIDFCATPGGNCDGGSGGLLPGQTNTGTFSLIFDDAITSLELVAAFARFQSVGGQVLRPNGTTVNFGVDSQSGRGLSSGVNITPFDVTPVPIPGMALAVPAGLLGLGWYARRRKQKQAA